MNSLLKFKSLIGYNYIECKLKSYNVFQHFLENLGKYVAPLIDEISYVDC